VFELMCGAGNQTVLFSSLLSIYNQPNIISTHPASVNASNQTNPCCMRWTCPSSACIPDASQAGLGREPNAPLVYKLKFFKCSKFAVFYDLWGNGGPN
jgi:hypothetical protein